MDPTDPGSSSRLDTVVCNLLNFILGFNQHYSISASNVLFGSKLFMVNLSIPRLNDSVFRRYL